MIFNNFGFNRRAVAASGTGPVVPVPASVVLALDAGDPLSYPGSGTTWFDLSTSANNSTISSANTYNTTGNANGGFINFPGNFTSTGSFNNPQNIPLGNSNYSTVTWVRVATNTQINGWLGWGQSAPPQSNSYRFTLSPALVQNYWYDGDQDFNIPFTPVVGSWYFTAFTWNNGTANFYMSGAFSTGSVKTRAAINVTNLSTFRVGIDTLNSPISGSLSFIRIYNTTLNSTEVNALYNATRARYGF